ncbi:putative odorant receptor 85d isoform X2 [Colletes latitarsis]|uniref:putative odorant receptor 85d isoform X2 n=1 Tax=Colletes latitarsis TaxID=2605962 RepID=UPI0040375ECB
MLVSHYSVSLVIQAGLTLGVVTCTMLRMFETLRTLDDLVEAVICTLHAAGNVLLVYMNIYSGQRLLDCSSDVFYKMYFARWYVAPLETQKSILIILQKTIEPCGILVASFINMSLEVFSSIIQLSLSYFTVLYSVRQ